MGAMVSIHGGEAVDYPWGGGMGRAAAGVERGSTTNRVRRVRRVRRVQGRDMQGGQRNVT